MKNKIVILGADTAEDIDKWPSFNSLFIGFGKDEKDSITAPCSGQIMVRLTTDSCGTVEVTGGQTIAEGDIVTISLQDENGAEVEEDGRVAEILDIRQA